MIRALRGASLAYADSMNREIFFDGLVVNYYKRTRSQCLTPRRSATASAPRNNTARLPYCPRSDQE